MSAAAMPAIDDPDSFTAVYWAIQPLLLDERLGIEIDPGKLWPICRAVESLSPNLRGKLNPGNVDIRRLSMAVHDEAVKAWNLPEGRTPEFPEGWRFCEALPLPRHPIRNLEDLRRWIVATLGSSHSGHPHERSERLCEAVGNVLRSLLQFGFTTELPVNSPESHYDCSFFLRRVAAEIERRDDASGPDLAGDPIPQPDVSESAPVPSAEDDRQPALNASGDPHCPIPESLKSAPSRKWQDAYELVFWLKDFVRVNKKAVPVKAPADVASRCRFMKEGSPGRLFRQAFNFWWEDIARQEKIPESQHAVKPLNEYLHQFTDHVKLMSELDRHLEYIADISTPQMKLDAETSKKTSRSQGGNVRVFGD